MLVTLPALVFYFLLFKTAVNLPILDDYQIILGTTNLLSQTHNLASQAAIVLTSEHNGYKLMFENVIVWTLHALIRAHTDTSPRCSGNAFALVIFLAVALMARDAARIAAGLVHHARTRILFVVSAAICFRAELCFFIASTPRGRSLLARCHLPAEPPDAGYVCALLRRLGPGHRILAQWLSSLRPWDC